MPSHAFIITWLQDIVSIFSEKKMWTYRNSMTINELRKNNFLFVHQHNVDTYCLKEKYISEKWHIFKVYYKVYCTSLKYVH